MRYLLPRFEEVPLWPLISAPLFLMLFLALVWWIYRKDRKKLYETAEKLPLEPDGLAALGGMDLARWLVRSSGALLKSGIAVCLVATQPLAHGLGCRGEGPGGGFDAVALGKAHQAQPQVAGILTLAHEVVVWERAHRADAS